MVFVLKKHSQLPVGGPKRKFKGRGVLLGNQVKNQSFEAATFQDLGNSPASFEALRWAEFLGCHDGWDARWPMLCRHTGHTARHAMLDRIATRGCAE